MKILFAAVALATSAIAAPALLAAPATAITGAQMVTVKVNGLVCDFCARSIEAMMKRRSDVSSIHIDLAKGEVHLALKAGAQLDDATLTKVITDSGYAVTGITREPR
ncbi:MAG: heavy-metal-associated domain-containing protein [Sandarakinorhabdus sp.]|nr:heavy-metal-associated domain-containing protein [Sandarakinorhabdus sp.]